MQRHLADFANYKVCIT